METKKCKECGIEKPITEFYKYRAKRTGEKVLYTQKCKICESSFRKEYHKLPEVKERLNKRRRERKKEDPTYREKINRQHRDRLTNDPIGRMFYKAKERARRNNIEFNITKEDIIIPEECPILGVSFKDGTKGDYDYTPSLDRIDNSRGYIKGNIAVISNKANTMKNSASIEEIITFSQNIVKYLQKI